MSDWGWMANTPRDAAYWELHLFVQGGWSRIQTAFVPWTDGTDPEQWVRDQWENRPWPDGRYRVIVTDKMDEAATVTHADVEVDLANRPTALAAPKRLDRR